MATSAFDEMTNESAFLEMLNRIQEACVAPWHKLLLSKDVLRLLWIIAKIKTASDAALRELRAKLSTCQAEYEMRYSCFEAILEDAKNVRQSILVLQQTITNRPLFSICNRIIDDLAVDWDDMVEDLAVSGDPEFHSLAANLASIVNAPRQTH